MPPRTHTARSLLAALAVVWLAYAVHVGAHPGGQGADAAFEDVVYPALVMGAAVAILLRAACGRSERRAWALLGGAALLWALGDVYFTLRLKDLPSPPLPSPADALSLAFYPAAYVALAMLVRSRLRSLRPGLLLDGLLVGVTVSAVVSAVTLGPIVAQTGDVAFSTGATNITYLAGDLVLLVVAIAAVGLSGWRPSASWLLIGASLALSAIADVGFLYEQTQHSRTAAAWLHLLWAAGMVILSVAAWVPAKVSPRGPTGGRRMYLIPALAELAALALLVYSSQASVYGPAVALATLVMVVAAARMSLMLRDNQRMLTMTQADALTDALTGLSNRRALGEDLAAAARMATESEPLMVVFYDLDGFKQYNDTFGHLAGDALLARLGARLAATVDGRGQAYRLGGDEFCSLLWWDENGHQLLDSTVRALGEEGSGFNVRTSYGHVLMPQEAADISQALTLADQRLYLHKDGRPGSAKQQLRDVLLQAFRERQPALQRDPHSVRELSAAVARRLGMGAEEIDVLARAAELHDVGKIAVPDAILEKPDSLSDDEAEFMRRHPVLGQRILAAAPALRPVADVVRSTHERWDGRGYPDGLAGDQIPLGARIIAVCDAFDAIVSGRPYRAPLGRDEAIRRLVDGSGTQFDPSVVGAVLQVLAEEDRTPARAGDAGASQTSLPA